MFSIKFNRNNKSIELEHTFNHVDFNFNKILESIKSTIDFIENKRNYLKPIFVPEDLLNELLLKNLPIDTLLSIDNLINNNIGYKEIKSLVLLNSLGTSSSISNVTQEQKEKMLANLEDVGYNSYFNHLLDEVADIRSIWLNNCCSVDALKTIIENIEQKDEIILDSDDSTRFITVDTYLYDTGNIYRQLLTGICLNNRDSEYYHNNIIPSKNGFYYFIPVSLIDNTVYKNNDSEFDNTVINNYVNNVIKAILRKATCYFNENEIAKSDFFSQYLLTL